jgi:hypothetical protein
MGVASELKLLLELARGALADDLARSWPGNIRPVMIRAFGGTPDGRERRFHLGLRALGEGREATSSTRPAASGS